MNSLRFERGQATIGRPQLAPEEIHLYAVPLDPGTACQTRLRSVLAADELERAARFHFERDRRRFVVARGVLRYLLSAYLPQAPAAHRFVYGAKGKPALANGPSEPLFFNVSHSEERVLIGLTRALPLGVDIEYLRPMSDAQSIAERFFSTGEAEVFRRLPEGQQTAGFFNCWTRKEAYLKATGDGLSAPLDSFDLTLVPGEEARMLRMEGSAERAAAWSLVDLQPASGYVGALCVERQGLRSKGRKVTPEQLLGNT